MSYKLSKILTAYVYNFCHTAGHMSHVKCIYKDTNKQEGV